MQVNITAKIDPKATRRRAAAAVLNSMKARQSEVTAACPLGCFGDFDSLFTPIERRKRPADRVTEDRRI